MPSITATTTARCPCCSLTNTLQCRTKSGTAEICGHSEFPNATGGVSTPPKKYRTKTASGTMEDCAYTIAGCSGSPAAGAKYVYSGTCTYDSSTCGTTNTLNYKEYNDAACPATTLTTDAAQACSWGDTTDPASASCLMDITVSKTRVDRAGTNDCCEVSPGVYTTRTGSMYWELSTEDTETDAITRFGNTYSWGSWITSGATGCTGTPPICCLAKYESRTSGFTFAYAEAEARVTATGLTPSTNYTAKIELYRRTYGSGSYTWYQTATVTGTSDGAGNLTTAAVTVTNTKGYETYAASSSLFVT
jgi:hypothetical protein